MVGLLVYRNVYSLVSNIGHHLLAIDNRSGLKLYATSDAVPVALGLISNRVGILTYTHILYTIINTHGNLVFAPRLKIIGNVVLMWHREAHLVAHLATIHENGSLNVRALKVESYASFLPLPRNHNLALIPRIAHVMAFGRKEEGELHLPLVAILLHVGIKVETGVVERASPTGIYTYGVSLAVSKHRARKLNGISILRLVTHTEIPLASKRYNILSLNTNAKHQAQKKSNCFVHFLICTYLEFMAQS